MQNPWETWKKGFGAWESATAAYLEKVMDNPAVLGPAGILLTAVMRGKAAGDRALASWWGAVGLPTKRDQERTLHKLNQLESRLCDLEEKLEALCEDEEWGPRARSASRVGGTAHSESEDDCRA